MAHSQTAAFRHLVRDHIQAPPVVASAIQPALEVVARMTEARASAAVILDAERRVTGIVTEQDVTRRIAGQKVGTRPIADLMSRPVATIGADQPLYEAIGFMRRLGLSHMPVVDPTGGLAGMLYLHDALAAAQPSLVEHIDQLTHETTLAGLREVKTAQVRLAADLFADRVPAPEIQSLISHINNDIYRRVVRLNLDAMQSEGWGPPPVAFSVIVMGSGGRGESFLFPDQDNGFVLADYPDHEHGRIDPYFIELALRLTTQMDQLGFPSCRGGVMAINPVWRKTIGQWRHQVTRWIRTRSETAMLLCDVLFDFQSVYGAAELADALRGVILHEARNHPRFLRDMFGVQADHRAALGWFNRLLTVRGDPERRGQINLKFAGTLPLAEGVRLLALRDGIAATGTLARLEALVAAGRLTGDDQDRLRGAFEHITGLQLRQQIADYEAGLSVSNFVDPAKLTARELDQLKEGFRAINDFRALVKTELTGEVL